MPTRSKKAFNSRMALSRRLAFFSRMRLFMPII
jgi:hypothetical protein